MAVYFIAENENNEYGNLRIKIGLSKDVQRRLRQLETGSPYKLKLMGWIESDDDRRLEKNLHKKYSDHRVHLEWFSLDATDIFEELLNHSTNSFLAVNDNAFEIVSYDRDNIPECVGAWQWGDTELNEFCPSCGWGGGLDYNENYGGVRCLRCGITESQISDLSSPNKVF